MGRLCEPAHIMMVRAWAPSKRTHPLYYLHRLVKAAIFRKISFSDLLSLTKRRLGGIRDDDLQFVFAF